ncbi:GPI ethanolamine phosphate transferase, putative [Ixodes scapularis]|uniref:GPI ethanolamine phosphate transferase 1 n=1 Tax=Ixodes scapularis TaxID=6945 RepID=B7PCW0_IXOSC|nr:GPI ethanolamine phosphate transferase, putative [Ixodes scapularis]|eukprot:XP_002410321.1 GPI ethanolamine phosphate transferase, putative [Ixodes scapularis]
MLISVFAGAVGLAVHVVFLFSIFDIYFKSPIIHGLPAYEVPLPAPASRLVLIVADGLRADKVFELQKNGTTRAPYLRSIITEKGSWGISHTRVPTESRPGHVALIAGFYEDVSAVTKGWKDNPVEFDSVFNRSRYVWAWGAADMVHLFTKGDHGKRVFACTYDNDEVDFADEDASRLDTWVFAKFEAFLASASTNKTLKHMLQQDKLVFFLHLLGLDTNGHGYNPDSMEYYENIALVDRNIKRVVQLIDEYYQEDGKTAYIFTSDHGMTDWGNHGAGNPSETETPLIAWGAGIGQTRLSGKDGYYDGYSEAWNLSLYRRVDVKQADLAPLMAVLLGIAIPINSLGLLPVEYLNRDSHFRAVALLTNARQILAQFKQQEHNVQETTFSIFFRQFKADAKEMELTEMMETLLKQSRYKEAVQVIEKFIELALKGLTYYQKYDRLTLSIAVALGFVGWMTFVILLLLRNYTGIMCKSLESQSKKMTPEWQGKIKILSSSTLVIFLSIQNAPFMYYFYFLIPIVLWTMVLYELDVYYEAKAYLRRFEVKMWFLALAVLAVLGLELLVITFFYRGVMSLGLVFIGLWPFTTQLSKRMSVAWLAGCLALGVFPLLPVIGKQHNYTLCVAQAKSVCLYHTLTLALSVWQRGSFSKANFFYVLLSLRIFPLIFYYSKTSNANIEHKEGLPLFNQILSWLLLVLSPVLCLFSTTSLFNRLLNLTLSLLVPFLLMCIFYESLFFLTLCLVMFLWICIEHQLSGSTLRLQDMTFEYQSSSTQTKNVTYHIKIDDVRKAYFFMFFMLVAFYGTGNIASLNSFSISSFYCFMTVFRPFTMAAILLIKVLIPLLIVSCAFRALLQSIRVSNTALFLLVFIMSDFTALHFFFLIKDSGSWLDIGMSISHYLLSMGMFIFTAVFHGLAWFLTTFSLDFSGHEFKRHLL